MEQEGNKKEDSEQTQQYIDEEISRLMNERYTIVLNLLTKHRDLLEKITDHLMDAEIVSTEEFLEMIHNDEAGAAELERRKELDMKVSERAAEKGQKRNDAIIARNKAREIAESNEPPRVNPEHRTENPWTREVPLTMEGEEKKELPEE